MTETYEGRAIVYCEGAFNTTNGKTAHGLVRRSRRYRTLSVVDSRHAGRDAGQVLDGRERGIPIWATVEEALRAAEATGSGATHLVVGLAPDGGRLTASARLDVVRGLQVGLHVVCGLHDLLGDDPELSALAARRGVTITDVRRPPPRASLHFFSGKIDEVAATRVAVLGTDSAVGKRTTAWLLSDALNAAGTPCELVGTGQTAWLQGARHSIILDSLINDFVSGEIEHAVWSAWKDSSARALVLEGQGSLMNPAYPGGFELLAAGRPHCVVLQHAPARPDYDGFPGFPLHPLHKQIAAVELLSERPVVAITVNSEGLDPDGARRACDAIRAETGLPAVEPLLDGVGPVLEALAPFLLKDEGRF